MKAKWWILILIGTGILILVVLHDLGIIKVGWEPLAILLSALAAPFKMLDNWLSGGSKEKILQEHERIMEQERKYQENIEKRVEEKESEIEKLRKKRENIDQEIRDIEAQKAGVRDSIENMSSEEKKRKFREAFG